MSQTTRCPACETRFKVVADQLRISQGWVRCGNCQLVFDATVSLEAVPPEPMLPDMPLDQLRGPVARAAARPLESQVWQGGRERSEPSPSSAMDRRSPWVSAGGAAFAATEPGGLDGPPAVAPQPTDHVPAYLRAAPPAAAATAWGVPAPAPGQRTAPESLATRHEPAASPANGQEGAPWRDPWLAPAEAAPAHAPSQPAGYELPAAEHDDADIEWPLFPEPDPPAGVPEPEPVPDEDRGSGVPELDLAHFLAELERNAEAGPDAGNKTPAGGAHAEASPPPAAMAFATESAPGLLEAAEVAEDPDWSLVPEPHLHAPASPARGTPLAPTLPASNAGAEFSGDLEEQAGESMLPEAEPSFVRRARRRAFWSGAGVRAGLALLAVCLVALLAGQVAFQERERVATRWPQSRAWLASTCTYLGCSIGRYRDIASVLVDGSSFNRVQGERYQLALTLRNRAALAVESPTVELTLTDAQEQTVLRRVLTPAELAMPPALQAGQEWSAVTPMALGSYADRIAGYRVLAFYP